MSSCAVTVISVLDECVDVQYTRTLIHHNMHVAIYIQRHGETTVDTAVRPYSDIILYYTHLFLR